MAGSGNGDQGRASSDGDITGIDDLAGRLSDLACTLQEEDSVDATLQAIADAAVGTVPGAQYAALSVHLGQDLPEAWLIAEWPASEPEPVKYWLSNLPSTTAKRTLVRLAKLRWRIKHDYREVKTGSVWTTTKAAPGQAGPTTPLWSRPHTRFLTLQRLNPKPLRRNEACLRPTERSTGRLTCRCARGASSP